jgi:hypothetical protein
MIDVVKRTGIVIRPVLNSVLYPGQAFTYHFAVTLADGTTREISGRSNAGSYGALTLALKRSGKMIEKGYDDGL